MRSNFVMVSSMQLITRFVFDHECNFYFTNSICSSIFVQLGVLFTLSERNADDLLCTV